MATATKAKKATGAKGQATSASAAKDVDPLEALRILTDEIARDLNATADANASKFSAVHGVWDDSKIIPSPSTDLAGAIGIGGIPRTGLVEIFGPYSSGKTTLGAMIVASAQKVSIPALFVDAEGTLDPSYFERLGVAMDSLLVVRPKNQESAIRTMRRFAELTSVRNGGPGGVVILDSIPALMPSAIVEKDEEKQTMMLRARIWSDYAPIVSSEFIDNGVLGIFLNQLREGDKYTAVESLTPGGTTLRFTYRLRMELRRTDFKEGEGQTVIVKLVKNKVGVPYTSAEFRLEAGMGIDPVRDVIRTAIANGSILADYKIEDGDYVKKKGYFTFAMPYYDDPEISDEEAKAAKEEFDYALSLLRADELARYRRDERDAAISTVVGEMGVRTKDNEKEFVGRVREVRKEIREANEGSLQTEFPDDFIGFSVRYEKEFVAYLEEFPRFVNEYLRKKTIEDAVHRHYAKSEQMSSQGAHVGGDEYSID